MHAPHSIPLLVRDIQVKAKAKNDARAVLAIVALGPGINAVAYKMIE